jgi:PAS domain S-box-containing protein
MRSQSNAGWQNRILNSFTRAKDGKDPENRSPFGNRGVSVGMRKGRQWGPALTKVPDKSQDCLVLTDGEGTITYANDATCEFLGYSHDEIVGKPLSKIYIESNESKAVNKLIDEIKKKGKWTGDIKAHRKGGEDSILHLSASMLRDMDKEAEDKIIGIGFNPTKLKAAVLDLQRSNDKYRFLFENMQDMIFMIDMEGRFTFVNKAAEKFVGMNCEDILELNLLEIVSPEHRQETSRKIMMRLNNDEKKEAFEFQLMKSDGMAMPVEVITSPIYDGDALIGLQGVARDIRERMKVQSAIMNARNAEEADRVKSEFLANVSHELRTPLNAVLGFTEVMLDRMVGDVNPTQEKYLKNIYSSGKQLLSLVNDILDISKIESGSVNVDFGWFQIKDLITEIYCQVLPTLNKKKQTLEVNVPNNLPDLYSDKGKILRVLLNLLQNASKYTPANGHIILDAEDQSANIQFNVKDDGIGISDVDMDRIFDKFWQVEEAITKEHGGTGLGLNICLQLITLLGGRIWADSDPGRGTEFSVSIPKVPKNEASSQVINDLANANDSKNVVFIVEGERKAALKLSSEIKKSGYKPVIFYSGNSLIEAMEKVRPLVVFIDVVMPKNIGYRIKARMEKLDVEDRIPILIFTLDENFDMQIVSPQIQGEEMTEIMNEIKDGGIVCNH